MSIRYFLKTDKTDDVKSILSLECDVSLIHSPASVEYLTLAESRVGPLEARGEDLADVGEVEEEQRDPDHGVEDGHDLPDGGDRDDVAITCPEQRWMC